MASTEERMTILRMVEQGKITPEEGHYWDTKNGRCISLLKIALSAITGNKFEPEIQGEIILK